MFQAPNFVQELEKIAKGKWDKYLYLQGHFYNPLKKFSLLFARE